METVILEKTIIKSNTEKGNHRASNISHGVVGNTCWKWMIRVNMARKNAFEAFPRPLNRWKSYFEASEVGLSSGTRLWRGRAAQIPFC